jgi:hypothetical protein
LERLGRMLALDEWTVTSEGNIPMIARKGNVHRRVAAFPSLLDRSIVSSGKEGIDLWFSLYELTRDLPGVFSTVSANQ